ncbi:MAG: ROK family glucokinase [Eubacteriales bacterium]
MKKYCFGVDVGGTSVKLGLFDTVGELLEKWEIPTRVENNGEAILPDITKSIQEKIQEKKLDLNEIEGIGIGAPGPITDDGFLNKTANLGWNTKFNLEEALANLTKMRVKAANDANVAAFGEMWKGGGEGYSNLVMVTLGTGVGGGVIINGNIVTGVTGSGGEIGHLHVNDKEEDVCGCGLHGCLEQYASATGVVRLANRKLKDSQEPSMLRDTNVSAKTVFDAVKSGDALAIEIAEEFGCYLGTALSNIAAVIDTEVFVIGGGVSRAGDVLLEYIQKYYNKNAFFAIRDKKFVLATLGNDAGIYGAARLLL